ncbi:ATP synthase F1 subunit gamma [Oscillatoria laete-virens NRMC-F 0139]|nr:ATP synthase F1 subunit gamma [Oscillatoria laete-virens]MDL5053709.1 ATP synthase F1 subunit gamma [Oscillatoria laete-virens NRMC-F 0139]
MALRDIRRRIKSVKNTAQITKAMELVASSKMRKAQQRAVAGKPFARLFNEIIKAMKGRVEEAKHPFLTTRPVKKELVLVISTNRGLCGALNVNLAREALGFPVNTTGFVSLGKKGTQAIVRSKRNLVADFERKENFTFLDARQISNFLIERFQSGEYDRVNILFTNFINTLTQKPMVKQILPINNLNMIAGVHDHEVEEHVSTDMEKEEAGARVEFKFEPDVDTVLGETLPYYVHFMVYQTMLEAEASEHSARMVAMKSATDNAKQLIKDLTLVYNRERQAGITKEILEISTAQAAMG